MTPEPINDSTYFNEGLVPSILDIRIMVEGPFFMNIKNIFDI